MNPPMTPGRYLKTLYPLILLLMLTANITYINAEELAPESIPNSTRVDAEKLIELANTIPDLVIIDSRIRGDRKKGHIEDSVSLPNTETNCDSLAKIIPDKSTPTLYYCNGVKCGRSVKAIQIAQQCNYKNIYWFRGGFEEWLNKGLPYLQH